MIEPVSNNVVKLPEAGQPSIVIFCMLFYSED